MNRSVSNKSRGVCLIVASVLVAGALRAWAAPCANPVDRDINNYVLFAIDEMVIKDGAQLLGGNVGVNGSGLFGGAPRLRFGGTAFMSDGKQAVSDTARLTSDASVDQLFVNALSGNPPIVPRTCGPTPFTCLSPAGCIITNLPSCPSFTPGSNNVTVASGTTLNLVPGTYGDVRVNDTGVLNLAAGVYNLKSLSLGKNVRVNTTDQTDVNVARDVSMNVNAFIGPACNARFCVRSDGINNGNSVGFSSNGHIFGLWIVLNGKVDLGASTTIFGRIWARSFGSDPNVSITFCTPGECACINSFTPTHGTGGTIVTINGNDVGNVTQIRFSTTCDPNSGTVATILTQTATQLTVQVPALGVGSYHIINITGISSSCSSDLFLVP